MIRFRLYLLVFLLVLGFGAVGFRAFQLQVFPSEQVARLARRQLSRRIEISGRRGSITDRNGRELAVSTNSLSLFANPSLVTEPRRTVRLLSDVLGVPEGALQAKLGGAGSRKFVWLARQLDATQMAALAKIDLKSLKGVGVLPEFRREYPQRHLAAHVVGFTSIDGAGIEGVERQFNEQLRGEKNLVELRRDALGRPIFTHSEQIRLELNHGEDIELTIDSNLQHSTEKALRDAVEATGSDSGSAIVLDPRTGEILAAANVPTFDLNASGLAPSEARRNRWITDPIEPGSVVKPFVVARALEDRIVRPDSRVSGGGGFLRIGRKTIGEAEKDHRFKTVSITDLIRLSSNVGTVVLQQKMGWNRVEDTFRKVGFGSHSGVELGGESRGLFPRTNDKQLLERATMSFGQGIATTPLQIAAAYAIIANGGYRVRPHLVRTVGGLPSPATTPRRIFSEATAARMRTILEKVVEGEGTGTAARVGSFPVAGKTGTAQRTDFERGGYERGAYWSSFAGMVPSRRPQFVIYVMLDRPRIGSYYGGVAAAPVFAKIARAALQLVAPEDMRPVETPVAPAVAAQAPAPVVAKVESSAAKARPPGSALKIPDLEGLTLTGALRALEGRPVRLEILGQGEHVQDQMPLPGARVTEGTTVFLRLR